MKADLQRYKAVINAATNRLRLGVDGPLCADALESVATELLAIAEAVERAPVVDIYDSRAHGWTVDGDIPDNFNRISVRLLAIGEDG